MRPAHFSIINGAGKGLISEAAICQFKGRVLYVDCSNRFDPHQYFRQTGCIRSLEETLIVRPFTLYQLKSFVLEKLERVICESGVKYVLVSGIWHYAPDDYHDGLEYKTILKRISWHLRILSRDYQINVLMDSEV